MPKVNKRPYGLSMLPTTTKASFMQLYETAIDIENKVIELEQKIILGNALDAQDEIELAINRAELKAIWQMLGTKLFVMSIQDESILHMLEKTLND